jgi:hypothetical protein
MRWSSRTCAWRSASCLARGPGRRVRAPEPSLLFSSVQEGGGEERSERSDRTQAELGRLLAAAEGYRVLASDGTHVGWLDHVRYERHADRPDEIVIRRRGLPPRRRRVLPFSAVEAVKPRERTVVLRLDDSTLERSPSA